MKKFSQILVDEIFEMDKDKSLTNKAIAKYFKLDKAQVDYILYKRSPSANPSVLIKKELAKVRKLQNKNEPNLDKEVKVKKTLVKVKKTPAKVVEKKKPKTIFESLMDFFT